MEHPGVPSAILSPSSKGTSYALYLGTVVRDLYVRGYLALSANTVRSEGLLNARIRFSQQSEEVLRAKSMKGVSSAGFIFNALKAGKIPENFDDHVANFIRDLDDVVIYSYQRAFQPQTESYSLLTELEQAPNAQSRITLSDEKDILGIPKANLHWQIGELEKKTIRRINSLLALEMGRADIGRVRLLEEDESGWLPTLRGSWHQMGTTRMHGSPDKGVVDSDCRIFNMDNFFIAGSSVFPTSGYTNPTLTIVALSIRLADHIKQLTR
jgi:choline dehydrogenase-like flavoprotein